jgi:hypothetical protein
MGVISSGFPTGLRNKKSDAFGRSPGSAPIMVPQGIGFASRDNGGSWHTMSLGVAGFKEETDVLKVLGVGKPTLTASRRWKRVNSPEQAGRGRSRGHP